MTAPQPNFRVIIRLPYNRPEEHRPDPPRVGIPLWHSMIAASDTLESAGRMELGERAHTLGGHREITRC